MIDPFTIDASNNISDASGQVTIMGDLVVYGNTTTISSTNVDISDVKLTLASGGASGNVNGAGIELGKDGYASMTWNSTTQRWIFNKGIEVSGNILPKGEGQSLVSANCFSYADNGGGHLTLDILGDLSGWYDATGYFVYKNVISKSSTVKIEISVLYTASPEADQTISFRVLRSIDYGSSYNVTPVFSHTGLGSNMGVTVTSLYNASYYDNMYRVSNFFPNNNVIYKLQYNRNCPANDTITTPFGIKGSTGNYFAGQELYVA